MGSMMEYLNRKPSNAHLFESSRDAKKHGWRRYVRDQLKELGGVLLGIFLLENSLMTIPALVEVYNKQPNDFDDYRLALSVREYFRYLVTKTVDRNSDVDMVVPLQLALQTLTYDLGACGADGIPGRHFSKAVSAFQKARGLPETGVADGATIAALADAALADPAAEADLDRRLIAPSRSPDVQKFMADLPAIFSWTAGMGMLIRPDMKFYAMEGMEMREKIEDGALRTYTGCSTDHQRDALRHASMLSYILSFPTATAGQTVALLDLRERAGRNPLPIMFMDMVNHRKAVTVYRDMAAKGQPLTTDILAQRMAEAVRSGEFITYPLPLVPKDFR